MKMKRILFVMQLPPPVHGAAVMNEILANSTLISQHFDRRVINVGTAESIEDIGRFSLVKSFSAFRHLLSIIKSLFVFRPQVVYFTLSPSGFAFYRDAVYCLFMRLSGAKLTFHLHGKGIKEGSRNSRLFRWLSRRVFAKSHVIFLSESLRADVPFDYKAAYIVNYGLPVQPDSAKIVSSEEKVANLLYISNYVRTKGVLDLIDAVEIVARSHGEFHLTLAGKPFDITLEYLTEHVAKKGLDGKVTIFGPKYGEEKKRLLQSADLFILPTYYENEAFPLSILEAMQYSLPVISTYEGGIPDMIDNGSTGLLYQQRDIKGLADSISFLLDHPEQQLKLGRAAREKFLRKYTVPIFEDNILKALECIIATES
jgi:glycosyltransferase involved in cell wall biosynthesis